MAQLFSGIKNIVQTTASLLAGNVPGQLIIQYTDHCNALCPQCGMRKTEKFKRSRISVETAKRIIDEAAENNIQALSLTGGEPFLFFDEMIQLLNHCTKNGIKYSRTGTNGFLFQDPDRKDFDKRIHGIAESLGTTTLRNFWISIDSGDAVTHNAMRGFKNVIQGIEKALPILEQYSIFPSANLGINRKFNLPFAKRFPKPCVTLSADERALFSESLFEGFCSFFQFAIDLGFTCMSLCYPMCSNSATMENTVYGASSPNAIVDFSDQERSIIYQTLLDVIPRFRSKIRIFTPLCSLCALARQYSGTHPQPFSCRGGINYFFFSAADAALYPCGYKNVNT